MLRSSSALMRRRPRALVLVPVLTGLLLGAPASALAHHEPTFTCRASALRVATFAPLPALTIEPFATADSGTGATGQCPAAPQQKGLSRQILGTNQLPSGLGTVDVLFAETSSNNGGAQSRAGVLDLRLNAPAPIGPVGVEVLTSRATSACNAGTPALDGSSRIAAVTIAGQTIEPIPGTPRTIEVPGGILTVEFAKRTITNNNTITQQALVITARNPSGGAVLAQVVVAEAIADVHDCRPPCPQGQVRSHETGECMKVCPGGVLVRPDQDCPTPPPPAKCNAGRGNQSEPLPPSDCDPGRSGGKNSGGD